MIEKKDDHIVIHHGLQRLVMLNEFINNIPTDPQPFLTAVDEYINRVIREAKGV